MQKASFILAGVFLAALILGGILLVGILTPKYDPYFATRHITCGEPATMRAEGYNILGGTHYGRGPDDPGDDIPLANVDLCDPFVEVQPDGGERLWFWFQVEVIGQVFPYAAWGLPWEDLGRLNPASDRNPIDPIWSPESVWGEPDTRHAGPMWAGQQAHTCWNIDETGIVSFFSAEHGFTIPYGTTRSGWVCLTFSDADHPRPLPNTVIVTTRPARARLTRWVDAEIRVHPDTGAEGASALPILRTPQDVCLLAEARRPGSIIPGGPCDQTE